MAKKTDGWMPLYVADYLADTSRLTTEQHGAYMLIIMDYWRNGAPPDDDGVLSSITKLPIQQWRKHAAALRVFFSVCDGVWSHKRIDEERQKASGISAKRTEAANRGASARWGKTMPIAMPNGMPEAQQTVWQNDAPSPSPNTSPIGDGAPKPSFAADEPLLDNCPHQQIVGLYHEHLPSAIRVREWTPARAQALRARWREKPQRQNLEWWKRFFGYIAESDFLMGRTHSNGRKPFEIDLEWICQSKNFVKIIEGKFHEAKEVAA